MRIGSFTVTRHADNLVPKDDSYNMLAEQLPIVAGEAINLPLVERLQNCIVVRGSKGAFV